jgi:hypothetical protein
MRAGYHSDSQGFVHKRGSRFAMSDRIDRHLVIAAMEMAIGREHPPKG